jgi:tripartite-type tricarboxylate transporter receptor subunit TctC
MKLAKLIALSLLPVLAAAQAPAQAQAGDYPSHSIRLLVGFTAGGATDVSARLFAKKMGDVLGQSVVVENKTGAAGTLAAEQVARSPHDGYTLLYTTSSIHGISPHIYSKLSWDPIKDFAPIALAAKYPQALVVNNDVPANTLPELVALVRKNPGKFSYASAGTGGTQHLAAALLNAQARTEVVHVPYKGMSAAYSDLIAGRIQFMFDNAPSAIPFITSGKVKGMAVTSAGRMKSLPNVPTVAESGFPKYEVQAWSGFVAPAGTPRPIIDKLNDAIRKAVDAPEVKQWLEENGSPTNLAGTPEEFGVFLRSELEFWKGAVEISGAKLE